MAPAGPRSRPKNGSTCWPPWACDAKPIASLCSTSTRRSAWSRACNLCLPYDLRKEAVAGACVRMLSTRLGDLPVTIFRNQFTRLGPLPQEQPAFLALYQRFLEAVSPDVVLTYGGDPLAQAMRELTQRRKIPVSSLHNFAYHDAGCFTHVDYVAVPSQFSKDYYRKHLGLDRCVSLLLRSTAGEGGGPPAAIPDCRQPAGDQSQGVGTGTQLECLVPLLNPCRRQSTCMHCMGKTPVPCWRWFSRFHEQPYVDRSIVSRGATTIGASCTLVRVGDTRSSWTAAFVTADQLPAGPGAVGRDGRRRGAGNPCATWTIPAACR